MKQDEAGEGIGEGIMSRFQRKTYLVPQYIVECGGSILQLSSLEAVDDSMLKALAPLQIHCHVARHYLIVRVQSKFRLVPTGRILFPGLERLSLNWRSQGGYKVQPKLSRDNANRKAKMPTIEYRRSVIQPCTLSGKV